MGAIAHTFKTLPSMGPKLECWLYIQAIGNELRVLYWSLIHPLLPPFFSPSGCVDVMPTKLPDSHPSSPPPPAARGVNCQEALPLLVTEEGGGKQICASRGTRSHTHTHTLTHTHTHTHTHTLTHTHTHTHAQTHACTHIQTHTHTHTDNVSAQLVSRCGRDWHVQFSVFSFVALSLERKGRVRIFTFLYFSDILQYRCRAVFAIPKSVYWILSINLFLAPKVQS